MNEPHVLRRIDLIPASSVQPERVEWLIDCWLPRRSLVLLAGREGLGKSTIACDFAARATRGELENAAPMNVIYLQTEDSRSMTVRPRLEAAGADLDRVHFVDVTITDAEGQLPGSLDLPSDFDALETAIADNDVGLVILDAAKSAMSSKIDGNKDEEVRRFLEPMSRIADRRDCVFLGLVHFGKRQSTDTGKLILGSAAWSQVARSVLSVAREDETGLLLVTNTKANLAPRVRTVEATLRSAQVPTATGPADVGRIEWGKESDRDARDLLRADDDHTADDRDEIAAVVLDYLESQGGSAPAGDVLKATRAAGLNDGTVKNARRRIGVRTRKAGGTGKGWVWTIDTPAAEKAGNGEGNGNGHRAREGVTLCSLQVKRGFEGHEPPKVTRSHERGTGMTLTQRAAPAPPVSPAAGNPATDAIDAAILSSLTADYPLSPRTLTSSIPKKLRAGLDLDARLDALTNAGHIIHTPNGYVRAERSTP